MSNFIKGATNDPSIRQMGWGETQRAAPVVTAPDPVLERLREKVLELEDKLAEAQLRFEAEIAAARTEAKEEALATFVRDEADALDVLRTGVGSALDAMNHHWEHLESLAPLIAMAALRKVLAASDDFSDLMARSIARQLQDLRQDVAAQVTVSPADFPSEAAIETLRQRSELKAVQVLLDERLARGECRIRLRLGEIDLSLPRHWQDLRALLVSAADQNET